jgi:DNA-binding transcriptional regulator YiaG
MPGTRIKKIRKSYLSKIIAFSKLLMVNYETYRSWEEERCYPSSPGYAILHITEFSYGLLKKQQKYYPTN